MSSVRPRHAAFAVLLNAWVFTHPVAAQTQSGSTSETSRAQLIEKARLADSLGRRSESFVIHTRLRDGDFEVGDRIAVSYEGVGLTKRDTLTVQAGRVIRMGEPMGDLNLTGVLTFEVSDSITARVATYFKNEVVHVTPLVRLLVSGAVRSPGYYHVPPDLPFSDLIMRSAGQDQATDLHNIIIRRGDQIIWGSQDVQAALNDGLSIARLDLRPGDEIVVGASHRPPWTMLASIGLTVVTAIIVQLIVRQR
jgi:Periplasmic protein involved in polysaccharide export